MKSIVDVIKTALVKLMERESFVDFLQATFTLVLSALAVRLVLMLFNLEVFLKDAGVYFAIIMGGAAAIYLGFKLFNRSATLWLKLYFFVAFVVVTAVNSYRLFFGTYTPVLP